ncbi:AMP-binding enzyme [Streptomyces sp. NPDC001889]
MNSFAAHRPGPARTAPAPGPHGAGPDLAAIVLGHGRRQGTTRALVGGERPPVPWAVAAATVQRIAQLLRAAGIGDGHTVAVAADGPEHLLALLGTLAAGAAPVTAGPEILTGGWPAHLAGLAPAAVVADLPAGLEGPPVLGGVRMWLSTATDAPGWATSWPTPDRNPSSGQELRARATGVLYRVSRGRGGPPTVYRWSRTEFTRVLLARSPWAARARSQGPVRLLHTSGLRTVWGQARALEVIAAGGTLFFPPQGETTAGGLWERAARAGANAVEITGDRATGLAAALADRGPRGLSALETVITSGALCPARAKDRLLATLPGLTVVDRYESAEHHLLAASHATAVSVPPSGYFTPARNAVVLTSDDRPAILAEHGTLAHARPHAQGTGKDGPLPRARVRPGPGGIPVLLSDPARLDAAGRVLLALPQPAGHALLDGAGLASGEQIAAILLSHPHVAETAVVTVEHPARGPLPGALVVLHPGTDTARHFQQVAAHARTHLPARLHPYAMVPVTALPLHGDGRLNLTRARDLVSHAARPDTDIPPPAPRAPDGRWDDLVLLAHDEQELLLQALMVLLAAPDVTRELNRYLNYPRRPQPLGGLTRADAHFLRPYTHVLDQYVGHLKEATGAVLDAVGRDGWPDATRHGPRATNAAWLLLQHADARNQDRAAVLPAVAHAVAKGRTDPRHLALLTDRTRVQNGEPQQYGTLALRGPRGKLRLLYPLADRDDADRRRTAIGLPPLAHDLQPGHGPLLPAGPGWATEGPHGRPVLPPDPDTRPRPGPWHADTVVRPPVPHGAAPVHLSAAPRHQSRLARHVRRLPAPLYSTATWLEHTPATSAVGQFDAGPAAAQALVRLRQGDIRRSRLLITVHDPADPDLTTIETATALALGIPVVLTGAPASFPLLSHSGVTAVPTLDEALDVARTWAQP